MNIGIDIMGGDFAPEATIKGAASFLSQNQNKSIKLTLIGNVDAMQAYMSLLADYDGQYTIVPSESVIEMNEHPTKALKEKTNSSIAIGFGLLQAKKIDAFLSAGNTGAMMVGAMYSVKAIPSVLRPTIASPIPSLDGATNLLLDAGANADCKPENLVQFALMGAIYAEKVLGIQNPRIGLLNIGEEKGKGNILAQATYPLLESQKGLNFIGNIEGRDVFANACDVTVCEGFTGNIILKMAESIYDIFTHKRGIKDEFLSRFSYEIYGGTPILGINAPVIIGHGISKDYAILEMINNAVKQVQSNFTESLVNAFAE